MFLPVPVRWNEVETAVDPVVLDVSPVEAALVGEVLTKLLVDVISTHLPAVFAIDSVTKTWRVNNCQSQFHTFFFDFHSFLFDRCRFSDSEKKEIHRYCIYCVLQKYCDIYCSYMINTIKCLQYLYKLPCVL